MLYWMKGGDEFLSYIDYLACSRELPTGLFGLPPKAVYNSYIAYRNSFDFIVPRNVATGMPMELKSEDRKELERLKGNVVVYEAARDARGLSLEPYSPVVTRRGEEAFETSRKAMAKHFTLPFLYNLVADSEDTLTEYLCKYLEPGDQAEVYSCWAGEETQKRKGEDRIVDLEDVVRRRYTPDLSKVSPGNAFTRYLAPGAPQTRNRIGPVKRIDYVVEVIREIGLEGVVLSKAREQGVR